MSKPVPDAATPADDPVDAATEYAALAELLARHLDHRAKFHGQRYVSLPSMPVANQVRAAETEAVPGEARVGESETRTEAALRPTSAAHSSAPPADATDQAGESGGLAAHAPATTSVSTADDEARRRALRSAAASWTSAQKLEYLRAKSLGDCHRCPLSRGRRNLVFGVGNPEADIMFIGEAPGAEEDRRGEPFVGAAGQRLNAWLAEFGLARSDVYIANVLKCRPPSNRDPLAQEIATCSPFLRAQIRVIKPRVIVALGRFAGCLLLGRDARLHEMRRGTHTYVDTTARGTGSSPSTLEPIPLVVTYHPSYVLRSESDQGRTANKSPSRTLANDAVIVDLTRALSLVRTDM